MIWGAGEGTGAREEAGFQSGWADGRVLRGCEGRGSGRVLIYTFSGDKALKFMKKPLFDGND